MGLAQAAHLRRHLRVALIALQIVGQHEQSGEAHRLIAGHDRIVVPARWVKLAVRIERPIERIRDREW
jgi:hypothetical protein